MVNITMSENKLQQLSQSIFKIVQQIDSRITQYNNTTLEESIFNLIWRKYYMKNNTVLSKTNQK
jgi:hypothetical protein